MPTKRKPHSDGKYWSTRVTKESDALDLERRAFTLRDPKRIAQSRKRVLDKAKDELRRLYDRA